MTAKRKIRRIAGEYPEIRELLKIRKAKMENQQAGKVLPDGYGGCEVKRSGSLFSAKIQKPNSLNNPGGA